MRCHADRDGAAPEIRQRRASCANTELCTGTASSWHVTRDGVLAPEECSYQTIPSCSLGSVREQFWQVAVITLITRLLLIKKLSLKDDTMTLARHSLLPRSLVTMLCLTIILGLHCLMALTPQHSAALVTASLHTVIRTLDTASCCIMSPRSLPPPW